jgi:hypothetical protein
MQYQNYDTSDDYVSNSNDLNDILYKLKEKNSSLLFQLNDYNIIKQENETLSKTIREIESTYFLLKDENKKFVSKIEEYQKINKEWEYQVKEINQLMIKIDERNKLLKEENDKLIKETNSLEIKLKIAQEKEKSNQFKQKEISILEEENKKLSDQLRNIKMKFSEKEEAFENRINSIIQDYEYKLENVKLKFIQLDC